MTDGPGENGFTVIELMVTMAKPNVIGIVVRVVQCGADGANEVLGLAKVNPSNAFKAPRRGTNGDGVSYLWTSRIASISWGTVRSRTWSTCPWAINWFNA